IYVDIEFPEGILIYENNKEFIEPRSPIPFNPLTKAKREYNKKIEAQNISVTRFNSRIADNIGMGLANTLGNSSLLKNIRPINATYWTKLEGDKLTIKINDLLHTRFRIFNDEYMIVPLSAGNHTIYINIICEEYEETDTRVIEINI
ncbi:hypothetical protein CB287_22965, partial [Salmonella enterica subsp. enterica serovar Agama]|nr:hypothetical protein [Salmonella enterica subsp. enterica serovar Agama]